MSFGSRLKLLREERGLTQQMVADILKVERPTIAGYETKRKQPDYEKIIILADYFNVSIDYLLGRSDIRNPYIEKNLDKSLKQENHTEMTFGDKLKQLRESSGLKQEELGKIVNLSKATISRYEANTIEPNNETLKLIANYFNVSVDYLLSNSNMRNLHIQNSLDEVKLLGQKSEESKKTSPAYTDKAESNYIKKDSENLPENKNESSEPKLATTEMVVDKLIKAGLLKDDKIDARIANMLLNSLKIDIELKLKEEEKKKGSS